MNHVSNDWKYSWESAGQRSNSKREKEQNINYQHLLLCNCDLQVNKRGGKTHLIWLHIFQEFMIAIKRRFPGRKREKITGPASPAQFWWSGIGTLHQPVMVDPKRLRLVSAGQVCYYSRDVVGEWLPFLQLRCLDGRRWIDELGLSVTRWKHTCVAGTVSCRSVYCRLIS